MKVIDLLNKIANGEVPKTIKVDNKYTYIHDGIDYKNSDGTYLFNTYLETTTEDMNIEVEILEEEKEIPEKITMREGLVGSIDNKLENLDINTMVVEDKINEIIDYLYYIKNKGE